MGKRRFARVLGAAAGIAVLVVPPGAAAQLTETAIEASAPRGPRDAAEVEAFLDGLMAGQMRAHDVAGAVVAVVRNGEVVLLKGYGYADVDERIPVDPERTLFRIGSVSKLFTWTAVMQQMEAGRLDLDRDVNEYLDFTIPSTFDEPITMRHIMVHAAGFEDDARDLFSDDTTDITPLGEWLAARLPARVRPPGEFSAYSNYATALAGYVVERVSGVPYDEYVDTRILEPLGIRRTTSRQPLPARLAGDMSRGYRHSGARFEPEEFEIVLAAPAGSFSSSGGDMARFMIAHLGGGELDGRRILEEATVRQMHGRAFGHDPRVNGFGLGFYEKSSHGLRIIGHGGDTQWFHSDLALIPSENVGVFVSYNTAGGGELSFGPFLEEFLNHYYPSPPPSAGGPQGDAQSVRAGGAYALNRRSYTTFQKVFDLAQPASIGIERDGVLLLASPLGPMRFVPVGPLLYQEEQGQQLLALRAEESGRVTHAFLGSAPMMALERVPWYAAPRLHMVVLGLGLLVFVATILAAGRRFLRRRFRRGEAPAALPGRALLVGLSIAFVGFVAWFAYLASDFFGMLTGPAPALAIVLALPVIGALLTIAAAVAAVRQWRGRAGSLGSRLRYTAVVITALLFTWSLNTWNLLGWRF